MRPCATAVPPPHVVYERAAKSEQKDHEEASRIRAHVRHDDGKLGDLRWRGLLRCVLARLDLLRGGRRRVFQGIRTTVGRAEASVQHAKLTEEDFQVTTCATFAKKGTPRRNLVA